MVAAKDNTMAEIGELSGISREERLRLREARWKGRITLDPNFGPARTRSGPLSIDSVRP
jgi:hypothetical protein